MEDQDPFAGLPADVHADVLARLSVSALTRYRVAALASKHTDASQLDAIVELAAKKALFAFAERTYTDFVKGARELWTDGTEYAAGDVRKLVDEGPDNLHDDMSDNWPECRQVLSCDPRTCEPFDLTEGVYRECFNPHVSEDEGSIDERVMKKMTYDDGEWDGAPPRQKGVGPCAHINLLPGETWLSCWSSVCAFVADGTNPMLDLKYAIGADNPTEYDRPALPQKGYPSLVAPICLQRRRRQLLWLMFGGADLRGVDKRAQIGIGKVCIFGTIEYCRFLDYLRGEDWDKTETFKVATHRAMATAERLASIGRWELAVALMAYAVPEVGVEPLHAPTRFKGGPDTNDRYEWLRLSLADSFDHTLSEEPDMVRHVESSIAVSTWLIDQIYSETYVRVNEQDTGQLYLAVILTNQAIREMYTVVCKDGERVLTLEEAVTQDSARTARGESVRGTYSSALARLAAAMQAHARAVGIMAQHVGIGAMSHLRASAFGPPLFIWPYEHEQAPVYDVDANDRMAHTAKASEEMSRFHDSVEFSLFEDVDPNTYFPIRRSADDETLGFDSLLKKIVKERSHNGDDSILNVLSDSGIPIRNDINERFRERFREAALAARTAINIWRALGDDRRMYTAMAVYGEVSYCHASALTRAFTKIEIELNAELQGRPTGIGIGKNYERLDNTSKSIFGLLAVAKWSMEISIDGLREFGEDAALDRANVQKDLGKILSNFLQTAQIAMNVRQRMIFVYDDDPELHTELGDVIRSWMTVFGLDDTIELADFTDELRSSADRHLEEAKTVIETNLGDVHPWTLNIRRLTDPDYRRNNPHEYVVGMINDDMHYLEEEELYVLRGWKERVIHGQGLRVDEDGVEDIVARHYGLRHDP